MSIKQTTRKWTVHGFHCFIMPSSSSSSSTVRVVIFLDCRLPCVKTVMPDKTGKMPEIPGFNYVKVVQSSRAAGAGEAYLRDP